MNARCVGEIVHIVKKLDCIYERRQGVVILGVTVAVSGDCPICEAVLRIT